MNRLMILATAAFVSLSSAEVQAGGVPFAELQVGADVGAPFPWVTGAVALGWRFDDHWSAGITYAPLRTLFQDISTGNDTAVYSAWVSGLHIGGEYWFRTHRTWGGRAGLLLGVVSPQLGVEMPKGYMVGAAAEGLLAASYGYVGRHLGIQLYARAGWKWGHVTNDTGERGMTGEGPVIVNEIDVSEPTFILGLTLVAWL